jgi:uncharacterized protein YciI
MVKRISILFVIVLILTNSNYAQKKEGQTEKKQFIYVLHLVKAMQDSAAWTPDKMKIVEVHFANLQKLLAEGKLILAGKTSTPLDKTFGIVVYEADSFEEAKIIAENDPAVKEKIMTVEVYPYNVALMRK